MEEQNNKNKRKTKLLIAMMIAIICVLFVAIVYQFIVIKSLQKQILLQQELTIKELRPKLPEDFSEIFFSTNDMSQ